MVMDTPRREPGPARVVSPTLVRPCLRCLGAAPTYTARQAACLFLRRPTELTISEQQDLTRMRKQDDILATIYTLTPAEVNEWKTALMPVHKEMEARVGKETIAEVYKETGFKP